MQVYIDLFDDEIYDPNKIFPDNGHFDYETDVMRMHIFLWLVFGQQIIVPEQWAISSASFQIVAAEILESYSKYKTLSPDHVHPPIIIRTVKRDTNSEFSLSYSYIHRLRAGKRIMLGDLFSLENEKSGVLRQELSNIIERECESKTPFQKGFHGSLQDLMGYHGTSDEITHKLSNSLTQIVKYDLQVRRNKNVQEIYLDERRYGASLAREVMGVQAAAAKEAEVGEVNENLVALNDFFGRVQKNGMEKFQIVDMWNLTRDYQRPQQQFIERLGRICMHQALRDQCFAEAGTLATAKPYVETLSEFEVGFQDKMRQSVSEKAGVESDLLFPTFATSIKTSTAKRNLASPAGHYDLLDKVPWENVWDRLWEFNFNEKLISSRIKLQKDLKKLGNPENLHECEAWDEFFDIVTKNVVNIKIARDKNTKTQFQIGRAAKDHGGELADIGLNIPDAVGGSPTAIFGLILSLGGILNSPTRSLYNHYMKDQYRPELIRAGYWCVDHVESVGF